MPLVVLPHTVEVKGHSEIMMIGHYTISVINYYHTELHAGRDSNLAILIYKILGVTVHT